MQGRVIKEIVVSDDLFGWLIKVRIRRLGRRRYVVEVRKLLPVFELLKYIEIVTSYQEAELLLAHASLFWESKT